MVNDFCHLELQTTDVGAAKKFYFDLFSWEKEEMDMGGGMTYTMVKPGAGPMGGIMQQPVEGVPSHWLVYIQVDNLDRFTAKAEGLGGKVLYPKTPIQEMGFFNILQDPTGAVFALWEPAKKD